MRSFCDNRRSHPLVTDMLIRFDTKSGTITMFGDVAKKLLRLMGQSGAVPGAILAADISAATDKLKQGLSAAGAQPKQDTKNDDAEPDVSLRQRAHPLIELLERAAQRGDDVVWEEENRRVI